MKTHREIQEEARRLEQLGRQYWTEGRQRNAGEAAGAAPLFAPHVLFRFPDTTLTISRGPNFEMTETRRMARRIEVELRDEKPGFRLVEEEFEAEPSEGVESLGVVPVAQSDDVLDVLSEGYRIGEEECLAESLTPIVARLEEVGFCDGMSTALTEVEAVIGASKLSPASRLRVRANAVEFLEGRMRPSDFITDVVERHYEGESVRETVVARPGERLAIDQP